MPNNDSVLFYDPSSSIIPDTSETIAEVPDSIVPNTTITEKFDIIDADNDGNVHVETLAVDSGGVVPDISIPTVVADDFEYAIDSTDNVVLPETSSTIPSENNPCWNC